jgi:hypothetical protein
MQETNYFINPLASVPKACALWFILINNKKKTNNNKNEARAEENIF